MRLLALLFLAVGAVQACSDGGSTRHGALADACKLNSDCDDPLACSFGRCHTQCKESRDCALGQRCVTGDLGVDVCQLADEVSCESGTDCRGRQVCAIDRQCRDGCTASGGCLTTQLCVGGVCADPMEPIVGGHDAGGVRDGGARDAGHRTTTPDAGSDAGGDAAACSPSSLSRDCPDTDCQHAVGCTPEGQCDFHDVVPTCCANRVVSDATGVFVTVTGADVAGCGARTSPCRSIGRGVERAVFLQLPSVYVAEGLYTESVALAPSVTVEGGWSVSGATWTPTCAAGAERLVTIQAPATSSAAVTAKDLGGSATLRLVTIETKETADALPGESLYGILASGRTTDLALYDVDTIAASAGDGTDGSRGDPGADGQGFQCDPVGATGANGKDGSGYGPNVDDAGVPVDDGGGLVRGEVDGGSGGPFTKDGYVAGSGLRASPGEVGGNGPNETVCFDNRRCDPGTCRVDFPVCVYDSGGCGGGAGKEGEPGGGGGASVGIYAFGATITVNRGLVRAAGGGHGGDGGDGGPGGAGAKGEPASFKTVAIDSGCKVGAFGNCSSTLDGTLQTTVNAGQPGGRGGRGGRSGGGVGGASCAVVKASGGTVTLVGATVQHGSPGLGGLPAGTEGFSGNVCP